MEKGESDSNKENQGIEMKKYEKNSGLFGKYNNFGSGWGLNEKRFKNEEVWQRMILKGLKRFNV